MSHIFLILFFKGAVDDSPASQDSGRAIVTSSDHSEDCRFQYVLAAATSIATKVNEDTLTYLNQGQSYEIKLKKLGDLSNYRGRVLKVLSFIIFCIIFILIHFLSAECYSYLFLRTSFTVYGKRTNVPLAEFSPWRSYHRS